MSQSLIMNILVTGGAGYIGSHVTVELIESGYTPVVVDNFSNSEKFILNRIEKITGKSVKLYEGDCRDRKLMDSIFSNEAIQGAIHFAASKAVGESVSNPVLYYDNNINSLICVLEAMSNYDVQNLVFSSSCTVYGQPDFLPVTETSPIKKAESPYGNTKQICEEIIQDTSKSSALKSLALRYFNPIGAHPSSLIGELPIGIPNNLVPFITQAAAGLRDKITVFGDDYNTPDGSCIRDYIHVVDLAKAHVRALDFLDRKGASFFDFVNAGTGLGHSVLEVIETFQLANQIKVKYEIGSRRSGDVEKVYADASKARKILNWTTKKSLQESLVDAWNWQKTL